MNAVILFLLPVLGIIADANHNTDHTSTVCIGEHGSLLPMPDSCTDFFICRHGSAIPGTCGEFYRFNVPKGICDHPNNVNCDYNEIKLLEYNQRPQIEDPSTYTTYYHNLFLTDGIVEREPMQPLPKPIHPDEVSYDATAGAICFGQLDGIQKPRINDCEHFYVCIQQRPYRRTCAAGTHFNAALSECQEPSVAQCPWYLGEDGNPEEPPKVKPNLALLICVGAVDGSLVAHSADCGKYFYCDHAKPMELKCPKGLHFSAKHRQCVWPQLASCVKLYRRS